MDTFNTAHYDRQVVIITVDDPKEGSLNPAGILDSLESVETIGWPTPQQIMNRTGIWTIKAGLPHNRS